MRNEDFTPPSKRFFTTFIFLLSSLLDLPLSLTFFFFRATPTAHGGSQARGRIRATATGLYHSSCQRQILNPLSEARDRTHNPVVPSQIHFRCATTGTPHFPYLFTFSRGCPRLLPHVCIQQILLCTYEIELKVYMFFFQETVKTKTRNRSNKMGNEIERDFTTYTHTHTHTHTHTYTYTYTYISLYIKREREHLQNFPSSVAMFSVVLLVIVKKRLVTLHVL